MPRFKETRRRVGRFQCRWRQIAGAASVRTALILPGGPGLSSGYLASWSARLAKEAHLNTVLIEYPVFCGNDSPTPQAKLELLNDALAALFKRFAKHGKPILIGHSFSCRLLLELLRTRDVQTEALILMNCPASFDEGRGFARESKRLRLPDRIDSEDDFVLFWRRILPLYFGAPPKSQWLRELARDTAWMKCAWLADAIQGGLSGFSKKALPPTFFVHGGADRRFPRANTAILRKMFTRSGHAVLRSSGHFPMMEAEKESTRKVVLFLDNVRRGVGQ